MTIPLTSPTPHHTPAPAADTTANTVVDGPVEVDSITVTVALEAGRGTSRGDLAHAQSMYATAIARLRGAFNEADAAIAARGADISITLTVEHAAGR